MYNEICFENIITKQEFHVGDKITIAENMEFFDGIRNFKIKSFEYNKKNLKFHEWVYVNTKDGRSISINDLTKLQ